MMDDSLRTHGLGALFCFVTQILCAQSGDDGNIGQTSNSHVFTFFCECGSFCSYLTMDFFRKQFLLADFFPPIQILSPLLSPDLCLVPYPFFYISMLATCLDDSIMWCLGDEL